MNDKRLKAAAAILAFVMTPACSEPPKTPEPKTEAKKEAPKPPEPVSGKTAFYGMYKPARTWASDLMPLSLANGEVPGMKNEAGKAAMWTAVFVSPSRREARIFSYSVVDQGTTIHKGITVGGAEPWSGPTAKSEPFQTTQFVIDSDVAYETASHKAAAWLKNHPGKSVSFYLGSASRFPAPVWYVLWGNNKSGYSAYVNATTGAIAGK
jgi:hypothetical protein